jgi:hypothetical protein
MRTHLAAFPLGLSVLGLAASATAADPVFSLPAVTVPEGSPAIAALLQCSHPDTTIRGFSVSIRYDPARLQVTDVTTAGTSAAGAEYFDGTLDPAKGEIAYGAIIDQTAPLSKVLAPSPVDTLVALAIRPLAGAPAAVPIELVDGLGPYPIKNITIDGARPSVHPVLHAGSIAVVAGALAAPAPASPGPIDGGRRAVAFCGALSWKGGAEDGAWTGIRFRASGDGDESRLLSGARLYIDADGDGAFGAGDRTAGEAAAILVDDGETAFAFSESVPRDRPVTFFLVVDVVRPAAGAALIGPAAVAAALAWAGRRRRGRAARAIALAALLAGIPLAPVACGGGGGGGGTAGAPASREIRFGVMAPADLDLRGASSGVAAPVTGLPLVAAPVEV